MKSNAPTKEMGKGGKAIESPMGKQAKGSNPLSTVRDSSKPKGD